ncbi:hypothetical protein E1258_01465 [Micromonospora sp. KC207]|uniref:hypothetical protein n=1 Tax=Micromonospora sp. KC207 TaxID=2530377 RepID=UPI00104B6E80|nr:hypothetical protein [Micromonospora sp. KC207]TDC66929.1 hypothetical protein E1258_01465 [Micromonospora sp. KC207]
MRVRITWHVTTHGRGEKRIPAEVLRQEARRLMEALIAGEEAGGIANVAVETDAEEPSITAEAILPGDDTRAAADHLRSLSSRVLDHPRSTNNFPEWTLEFSEKSCLTEAGE